MSSRALPFRRINEQVVAIESLDKFVTRGHHKQVIGNLAEVWPLIDLLLSKHTLHYAFACRRFLTLLELFRHEPSKRFILQRVDDAVRAPSPKIDVKTI